MSADTTHPIKGYAKHNMQFVIVSDILSLSEQDFPLINANERERYLELETQVISKQRVADHGEVFTPSWIVEAMLELVRDETERIDSRFLEPACGTGNFLAEVLEKKLSVVESRYANCQIEYERYSVLAITSIYGIDVLQDNVEECRDRLFTKFNSHYTALYKDNCKKECRKSVMFILKCNIIWGDALTLAEVGNDDKPIIFAEWSAVNGSLLKRRDFTFHGLLQHEGMKELPLFSDLGKDVFIPEPVKDYPLVHFMRLADA